MYKKTITFTDYNGVEKTEDFYFNLNKAELMRMEMGTKGGLAEKIEKIVAAEDTAAIIEVFEDLIKKAYGKKTAEGGFAKNKEDLDSFVASEAYSELFMELATNAEAGAEFINNIVPAGMSQPAIQAATHPANK